MPLIGYARVSTEDQTPLPQSEALQSAGCAEIFEEHASGGNRARPVLARVLERVQSGDKRLICLPCDTYRRPWENCRAISKAVEGFRAMERHGAHQILDQAFEGFTALPAPEQMSEPGEKAWWIVLGLEGPSVSVETIRLAYKNACRDAGGATVELNRARSDGLFATAG